MTTASTRAPRTCCSSLEPSGPGPLYTNLLLSHRVYDLPRSNKPRAELGGAQTCAGLLLCNLADVGRCHKALCFGRWGCFLPGQTRLLLSGWKPTSGAEKIQCSGILCCLGDYEVLVWGQLHCSKGNFFFCRSFFFLFGFVSMCVFVCFPTPLKNDLLSITSDTRRSPMLFALGTSSTNPHFFESGITRHCMWLFMGSSSQGSL